MERLTKWSEDDRADCNVLYCPEECDTCMQFKLIRGKLAQIEDAIEAGQLMDRAAFIKWLKGEKYTGVDELSGDMSVGYENAHQWELSRNWFINKIIKHLEDVAIK